MQTSETPHTSRGYEKICYLEEQDASHGGLRMVPDFYGGYWVRLGWRFSYMGRSLYIFKVPLAPKEEHTGFLINSNSTALGKDKGRGMKLKNNQWSNEINGIWLFLQSWGLNPGPFATSLTLLFFETGLAKSLRCQGWAWIFSPSASNSQSAEITGVCHHMQPN